MSLTKSLGLLGLVASPAVAFWRLPCEVPIVVERADPIVSPGQVSGHVHTIMGGNGFDFTMDYNSTQASTCSSCTVIGDHSNYWVPTLYYQGQDGTFESVDQVGGATVYYLQRNGNTNNPLKAFPPGFRMISGDPFKRSGGTDFASQAISYNCLNYNGPAQPETGGFPNYNCPDGLRAQVFFPSCWNGKDLDAPDHKSHMSFPIGAYNDGTCPDDYPVQLISIFFEVIWDTGKFADRWYGNNQPFVFSMGDPTGYGGHGDFVMGWDENLLQEAVDQCTNLSGRVEDCPVFQLTPDSQAQGCYIEPKVNEQVSGTLATLPGCNPVRAGPGEVSPVPPNCPTSNITLSNTSGGFFTDLTGQGWAYAGCGTDNYYNRILTGSSTSNQNMTNENCVAYCQANGFSVAGSEYSDQCYCGNSIPASGAPVPGVPGDCKMACAGDSSEMCGGSGTISLYTKCTNANSCTNAAFGSGTAPGAGSGTGSSTGSSSGTGSGSSSPSTGSGGSSGESSPNYSSVSSPNQSAPSPTSVSGTGTGSGSGTGSNAGSGQGSSSGAGNGSNSGPGSGSGSGSGSNSGSGGSSPWPASSSSAIAPAGTSQSSPQGSTPPSSGSPPASSPSASPSGTATSPTSLPSGWAYTGCYTDTVFPRTLPQWSNFNGPNMTNEACISFCSSRSFPVAGTEYSGQCFCGSAQNLQNSTMVDDSKCSLPCTGDASEKCGGAGTLSVFEMGNGWGTWKRSAHVRRHVGRTYF